MVKFTALVFIQPIVITYLIPPPSSATFYCPLLWVANTLVSESAKFERVHMSDRKLHMEEYVLTSHLQNDCD